MVEHKHLMVIADVGLPPIEPTSVERWMSVLVSALGMKILIEPRAKYCDMPGNRGLTCICAIETSHIVIHAWDETSPGLMQLDVYTCADLDLDVVWSAVKEFEPNNLRWKFYDRSQGFNLLDEGLGPVDIILKTLQSSVWHFAKTMPEIPHWYTRGREWEDKRLFVEAVKLINIHGEPTDFFGKTYKYLFLGPYKYWTAEAPHVKPEKHILINRTLI